MTAADRDLLTERLAHVRWIAGGTGAGKSTLARSLADRYDVVVYDGDRAGPGRLARCDPRHQPHLAALRGLPPGGFSAEQGWF
nr:hypothetical protein OG999_49045 [Streptomyces sp. NBC_00886]